MTWNDPESFPSFRSKPIAGTWLFHRRRVLAGLSCAVLSLVLASAPCVASEPAKSPGNTGNESHPALSVARRFVDAVVAKDVNLAKGLVDPQWVSPQYLAHVVTLVEEQVLKPRADKPLILSPVTANTIRIRVFWQSAPECFVDFEMELTQSAPGMWRVKTPICVDSFPRMELDCFPIPPGAIKPKASIPQGP